jgi:hypothetical protein
MGTKTNTYAVCDSADAARRMYDPDGQSYPVAAMNSGAVTSEAEIRSTVKPQRLVGSPTSGEECDDR